jgi:hypothetical protein
MTNSTRKVLIVLGGTTIAIAAVLLRGLLPQLWRYARIRRM